MAGPTFVQGSYDQIRPSVVQAQGLYEISEDKQTRLGEKIEVGERTFRYAQASEALTAGNLATALADIDVEDTVTVAHPVGTFKVTVTAGTAITANQYADGMLAVDSGAGAADAYRVKSHPAAASGTFEVTLYDPLRTLWVVGTTDIQLQMSPYRVQESNTGQLELPVGVPLVDVTDEYYFWLQVRGLCFVLTDEAFGNATDQRLVTIGSSTAGSVEAYDALGEAIVGQVCAVGALDLEADKYMPIMLQLT